MAMLVIDWAQWPSFPTTWGWWCEKCAFSNSFSVSQAFFPSIITCPSDWVIVVQSAGKGSLFDICWVERREEKVLIIESYFPLVHEAWLLGLLCLQPHIHCLFSTHVPKSLCPPQSSLYISSQSRSTKACCWLSFPSVSSCLLDCSFSRNFN